MKCETENLDIDWQGALDWVKLLNNQQENIKDSWQLPNVNVSKTLSRSEVSCFWETDRKK